MLLKLFHRLKKLNRRQKILTVLILILIIVTTLIAVFLLSLTSADRQVVLSASKKFEHNDLERSYRLYQPKGEIKKIIIGLHGFSDSSRRFAYYTGLHNLVDQHTLVIYPDAAKPDRPGLMPGWNAGFCCGSGFINQIDDVAFIKALLGEIKQTYQLDQVKVFVTGFSNGAFMSQRLAIELPNEFSGLAINAGTIGANDQQLQPTKPKPILLIHGRQDQIVPFAGGAGRSDPNFVWQSFDETSTTWQKINQDQALTEIIINEGDGHKWHDWRLFNFWHQRPQGSQIVVNFFNRL